MHKLSVRCGICKQSYSLNKPGVWTYFQQTHYDQHLGSLSASSDAPSVLSVFERSRGADSKSAVPAASAATTRIARGSSQHAQLQFSQNGLKSPSGNCTGEVACAGIAVRLGIAFLSTGVLCERSLATLAGAGIELWVLATEGEHRTVMPQRVLAVADFPREDISVFVGSIHGDPTSQSLVDAAARAVPSGLAVFVLTDNQSRSMLLLTWRRSSGMQFLFLDTHRLNSQGIPDPNGLGWWAFFPTSTDFLGFLTARYSPATPCEFSLTPIVIPDAKSLVLELKLHPAACQSCGLCLVSATKVAFVCMHWFWSDFLMCLLFRWRDTCSNVFDRFDNSQPFIISNSTSIVPESLLSLASSSVLIILILMADRFKVSQSFWQHQWHRQRLNQASW